MTATRRFLVIFAVAGMPLLGQLENDTITITASRQVTLQPDQVVFNVQVLAPQTAGLDEVLAEVPGTGLTTADLNSVYNSGNNSFSWFFTLPVPLSQAGAVATLLTQLQQQSKQAVQFYTEGTQVSPALQEAQGCSQPNLISDARTQAQNLAGAGGFSVGPVLAVSDGAGAGTAATRPVFVGFFAVGAVLTRLAPSLPVSASTCAAVVKFRLYRYH